MEADHVHCMSCIYQRCTTKPQPGISCDVAACPLACGAVFHTCKAAEHRLLCPLEKVPCLNSGFGCPISVARGRMSSHLDTCPAGVVCCTMEWNRWPVSCLDYTSYESLSQGVEDAEQLDMALALQDQRTLLESLKVVAVAPTVSAGNVPDTVGDVKDPAVPATAPLEHPQLSPPALRQPSPRQPSPLSLAREKIANGINGLAEEHYSQLYEATVETARSLAAALDVFSGGRAESVVAPTEHCNGLGAQTQPPAEAGLNRLGGNGAQRRRRRGGGNTERRPSDAVNGPLSEPVGGAVKAQRPDEEQLATVTQGSSAVLPPLPVAQGNAQRAGHVVLEDRGLVLLEDWGVERRFRQHNHMLRGAGQFFLPGGQRVLPPERSLGRPHPQTEHKAVDTSDLEQEEEPLGLAEIDPITAALLFCLEESRECRRISDTVFVDGYRVDFGTQTFTFPAAILVTNTRVGDMASASACDHAAPQLSSPSPFRTLRLGLVLEALEVEAVPRNRYQHMFPFVCAQPFRRDQFAGHFANVHGDIHAGLNGWMEHRCPLAYYGCTFSQRRFYPSTRGARVIHDRQLRSFGVQPCPGTALREAPRCDRFSALPIEILRHVAGFLDSFSLCQLSLASRAMREVCASLLQARGIVELQWERRQCPGGLGTVSWHVKNKVWKFSTSFSPVSSWRFTDLPSMSDHLRKCRFNTVEHKTEPIPLPAMCTARDGHSLRRVLRHINT